MAKYNLADRYFRVFETAAKGSYPNARGLAQATSKQKFDEFSFKLGGVTRYQDARRIEPLAKYLDEVDVLDGTKVRSQDKGLTRRRATFKAELGDKAQAYLENEWNCPIQDIKQKAKALLAQKPPKLPTPRNLFDGLKQKPQEYRYFEMSLKVIAVVKSDLFTLPSRMVLTEPNILTP